MFAPAFHFEAKDDVYCCALNDEFLAFSGFEATISVHEWRSFEFFEHARLQAAAPVLSLTLSGERLASGDMDGELVVWSLATREALQRHALGSAVSCVALSAASDDVACACRDERMLVLGRASFDEHGGGLLRYSHQSKWLASVADFDRVCVYDAASLERRASLDMATRVSALAFSADDALLAIGNVNGAVHLYEFAETKEWRLLNSGVKTIPAVEAVVFLAFLRDAHALLVGNDVGTLEVWSLNRNGRIASIRQALVAAEKDGDDSEPLRCHTAAATRDGARIVAALEDTARVRVIEDARSARATAALYRAALLLYLSFRSSRADVYTLAIVADFMVQGDENQVFLKASERHSIVAAAFARRDLRVERARVFRQRRLDCASFCQRMRWLTEYKYW